MTTLPDLLESEDTLRPRIGLSLLNVDCASRLTCITISATPQPYGDAVSAELVNPPFNLMLPPAFHLTLPDIFQLADGLSPRLLQIESVGLLLAIRDSL